MPRSVRPVRRMSQGRCSVERMFATHDDVATTWFAIRDRIPSDLEDWPPGPALGAVLSTIDDGLLSGYDLVVVMRARARQIAYEQARFYATLAEMATAVPSGPDQLPEQGDEWFEFASEEMQAGLALTRRAADSELALARDFVEYPRVFGALRAGRIDLRRARVICDSLAGVEVDTAERIIDGVIDEGPRLTTGQLRARLRRLLIEADPEGMTQLHEVTVEQRRVVAESRFSGTVDLMGIDLPADRATAAAAFINAVAENLNTRDEPRSLDQLRADVFLDLLTGKPHVAGPAPSGVEITVDLDTLAELSDKPGQLAGFGPVVADVARNVVADSIDGRWRYVVTDQGRPVATGTTSRRPTAAMSRHIRARYRTCVFPGCRMPAVNSDLDHRDPVAGGGKTTVHLVAPLCRRHHNAKHHAPWKLERLPNGDHRWISPLGHTYTTSGLPP